MTRRKEGRFDEGRSAQIGSIQKNSTHRIDPCESMCIVLGSVSFFNLEDAMLYLHDDGGWYGFAYQNGPLVEYDQFLSPIRIVTDTDEHQGIIAGMMDDDSFVGGVAEMGEDQ